MKNNVKGIFYVKKGSFKQSEYLKIEILEDKNLVKYSINDLPKILEVSNDKEQYINNNFTDGTTWQLKIVFKDNSQKNYLGQNSFPNNFENFNKIKNELLK